MKFFNNILLSQLILLFLHLKFQALNVQFLLHLNVYKQKPKLLALEKLTREQPFVFLLTLYLSWTQPTS